MDPTAGNCNTLSIDSLTSRLLLVVSNGVKFKFEVIAVRDIFGGLPNNTDISKSIGVEFNKESVKTKRCSSVATPTTANGALSR
ncbi:Uncharacterised protein [Chlamydia trachomatis]|nr:Uncharacterised protein [Chlamydia trachomatis]